MSAPVNVFISYAHEDSEHMEALKRQLSGPARSAELNFRIWHDKLIEGGSAWEDVIKQRLESADLVVFLLSSYLMDSDYIGDVEAPLVFERRERNECEVLTVQLGRVTLEGTLYERIQYVPKKPIDRYEHPDDAWVEVTNAILALIKTIRLKRLSADEHTSHDQASVDSALREVGAPDSPARPVAKVFVFPPKFEIRNLRQAVATADFSAGTSPAAAALHLAPLLRTLETAAGDKNLSAYQRGRCSELHDAIAALTGPWSTDSERAALIRYAEDRRSLLLAALDRDPK